MSTPSNIPSLKNRSSLAYQQRQKIRRHHLEKKQALRRIFEMGKVVEKAGFRFEELDIVYDILVEARKKIFTKIY